MKIEKLTELVQEGKSTREIAKTLNCGQSTVIYWLKKLGLTTFRKKHLNCKICQKEFNQLQERNRSVCNSCNTKKRRYKNKLRAIELLGGCCERCGYDKHPAALEFHHRNPEEKSFTIGMVGNKSWSVIVEELKKCELICSNCHNIEHSNRFDINWDVS